MKLNYSLFITLLLLCQSLIGQHYFSKSSFELGKISQINQDIVELNLVNRSEKDIYLLRLDAPQRISIKYSSKKLASGEAVLLRLKLNPNKKGKVVEKVEAHLSSNLKPVALTFQMNVQSIPKDDRQSCPDFSNRDKASLSRGEFAKKSEGEINRFFIEIYEEGQIVEKEIETNDSLSYIETNNVSNEEEQEPIINNEIVEPEAVMDQKTQVETVAEEKNRLLPQSLPPNNIVFLIDASSSMEKDDKMILLKSTMISLLNILREKDFLSIVIYSGEANTILNPTSGINKSDIKTIINEIQVGGSTHAAKGINEAIKVAQSAFKEKGNNQIILATDGAFEIGSRNLSLRKRIRDHAEKGINVSVLAIKNSPHTKRSLKEIIHLGNGDYIPIKSKKEIDKVSKVVRTQVERIQ